MTAIESINQLLDEIRPLLIMAGVPEKCIKIKKGKHRIDACSRAFDWLHELKLSTEFAYYNRIRALLPESTWNKYVLFEIEDLREQKLLKKASRAIMKRWTTKRPAMFKGHKNEKN